VSPLLPLVPLVPLLPLVPLAPLPPLLPLPLPIEELPLELPLLPPLSLPPPIELHAESIIASKPAKSTPCSLRFMINSFGWVFFVCCVTMPRATGVRGAILNNVPRDSRCA
jgi:hypothetical protein